MKQIDIDAAKAFWGNQYFKKSNTHVVGAHPISVMYLHGNLIAKVNGENNDGCLTLSSCGWKTATTRARLNGVLTPYGFTLSQKAGKWYIITPDMQKVNFYDGIKINLDTKEVIK